MANLRIPKDYKKKVFKSQRDRSVIKRTTFHPGLLIPIYTRRMMAGERIRIDLRTLIQSNPLVSQLLGTFKLRAMVFFDSDANYYGFMDNNTRVSSADLLKKKRHQCVTGKDYNTEGDYVLPVGVFGNTYTPFKDGVGRHSLLDFLGVSPGYINTSTGLVQGKYTYRDRLTFDVGPILTYLNIFRNYFANDQEANFPVYTSSSLDPLTTIGHPIEKIDQLFRDLRHRDDGYVFRNNVAVDGNTYPGMYWFKNTYLPYCGSPYGGLLTSTYLPDQFSNLMSANVGATRAVVEVKDGQFNIDELRFKNKLQRLIDRYDVSGGRFSNWLRTVWGVETRRDMDIPELMGVSQSIIDPSQLSAMAQTGDSGKEGSTDFGQFGGHFDNFNKHRPHSFMASTPGRVMVIVNLVPMVDYCQNIDSELLKVNFADDYTPEMSQLGFQSAPLTDYSCLPEVVDGQLSDNAKPLFTTSVGKQVAWLGEMTDYNRVHGEFSVGGYYESWCLQRRFWHAELNADAAAQNAYTDITQYINPLDFQYPFVGQSLSDPNWFLQMAVDVKTIRPIGKRFMPNLE